MGSNKIIFLRTTCGADGKWSHPLPSCLSSCLVPEILNGEMDGLTIGDRVEHGQAIAINCSDNYEVHHGNCRQI